MKKIFYTLKLKLLASGLLLAGFGVAQTTYTFTTGGQTGMTGPTQAMIDAAYAGTNLDGAVTVTGGIQTWVVPATGNYRIEAFGAQGYGSFGGRGAHISGEFTLTAGTTLHILVGQQAPPYLDFPATTYNNQYGGGGGSFVTDPSNNPYVVAGGGGGNHSGNYLTGSDGQITEAGAAGATGAIVGAGGTAGNGGQQATSADGGGGLLTNGAGLAGGFAYVNGGNGGADEGRGGFGCGGGTSSWNNYRGGGGGGYSGGGGANNNSSTSCCAAGGGGGSFNGGTNPTNLAGVQLGDGEVVITNLCLPSGLTADQGPLSDINHDCFISAADVPVPTATNSCSSGIPGIPDVTFPITTVGTTVVTWTWDDGVNQISQTQNLIISGNDVTAPVPDLATLPDVFETCEYTPVAPPSGTDNCGPPMYATPDVTFPITTPGATVITWTYTDGSGNTTTQTQTVTLDDNVAPVLEATSLPDLEGCSSVTPSSTPTAIDNCAGTINGVPDVSFPITTVGLTVITWTFDDGSGNTVTQTQNVTVNSVDNSTTLSGATITASLAGASYQWINCETNNPISGETNQSYTPTVTGEYAVIVYDGTCSDTSACVLVDFTGIDELNSQLITIYPNPTTKGTFTVQFDGNMEDIVLIDALGRTVDVKVDMTTGKVDGSALAPGKYMVKVITSTSVYTKGLVIIE